jgi:integrase
MVFARSTARVPGWLRRGVSCCGGDLIDRSKIVLVRRCAAGAEIGIHQLRHAHATELINSGVSIEVVRRRLGHASTETTQVYTLLADKVADTEIRAARRRRDQAAAR